MRIKYWKKKKQLGNSSNWEANTKRLRKSKTDVFTVGLFRYIASFVDYRANCGIKLINHRLDYRTEPLSQHLTTGPDQSRSRRRSQPSPATAIVSSTDHIVAWLILTIVPPSDLKALQSHRVEFAATGNTRCHNSDRPYRCHDYYQRHIAATATDNATSGTTSTGNASPPPLSVTRRRHRFRQHHDHYQQRFAATAIGNTSPPPLPATPRPLSAKLRRHRHR